MNTPSSTDGYIAISENALIEGTKVEFDVFLKNDVGGRSKHILFCRGNQQFSAERKGELLSKNANRLYISTKDTQKYLKYQEKNLRRIVEDSSKSSLQKSGALYQVAGNITQNILDDPKSGQNIERASEWVGNTVAHIIQNENTFSSLFEVTSNDYRTYTHSINVSVIGLLFGKYLSLDQKELDSLGTGLLLHDIGKSALPNEILSKYGELTKEESNEVRKHPKAGFDLLEHREDIDVLSLKVVLQHHENNDGTGYPYGLAGKEIHLFGQISRIVDAYDAMTSNRPYAAAMKPFATLGVIKEGNKTCFNEELLKEFICFLGLKDRRSESRAGGILLTPSFVAK
ncbi:MAG: HD domain-containing protein [Candidatus Brocadiales bacterium]|nr:HD domain-containing protein [Candidatus Brocadiales bacterium]